MSEPMSATDFGDLLDLTTPNVAPKWTERDIMLTAAREALAPIRELHKRGLVDNPYCDNEYECVECTDPWPCDTAKLAYATEELQ